MGSSPAQAVASFIICVDDNCRQRQRQCPEGTVLTNFSSGFILCRPASPPPPPPPAITKCPDNSTIKDSQISGVVVCILPSDSSTPPPQPALAPISMPSPSPAPTPTPFSTPNTSTTEIDDLRSQINTLKSQIVALTQQINSFQAIITQLLARQSSGTVITSQPSSQPTPAPVLAPPIISNQPTAKTSFSPTKDLAPGMISNEVSELQKWLIDQGFNILAGITGYFGEQTKKAVAAWQKSNNIKTPIGQEGFFGSSSRQLAQ